MMHLNPLVLVGAVIGVITALLVAAYAAVTDKKTAMGFERNMEDGEIMRRLARYARPYLSKFLIVGLLMLFSIAYDIISPLIVGRIEELVAGEFELRALFLGVSVYAGVLVFSMGSTYLQAVILQRVGQRIISDLREDLFSHIESLAHEQLNEIPVGKLVTRVTNDTNAISMMFTNLLVQLTKNSFVHSGHSGGHALPELRADPDGALLCALHRDLHGHLPQVLPPRQPQAQERDNRYQYLSVRKTCPASRSRRSLAARTRRWRISAKRARSWPGPIRSRSSCSACSVRWCICSMSARSCACSIWAAWVT